MPEEENKKLRDLVSETLQAKGVLGRIQAEIRSSVFLALEEQDVFKDKSPFINKQLKDFLKSSDGITVISLVKEFLEFFNLEFTLMVFDPETHAGFDYDFEGRAKLAALFNIHDDDKHQPLLSHILKLTKSTILNVPQGNKNLENEPINSKIEQQFSLNNENSQEILSNKKEDFNLKNLIGSDDDGDKSEHKEKLLNSNVKDSNLGATSLASLSNLPPIGKAVGGEINNKKGCDLKSLLETSSDRIYEDDFLSSDSDHLKKEAKVETGSEESEVEEELSGQSNQSGQLDDNTNDITISKESGHGDYLENV